MNAMKEMRINKGLRQKDLAELTGLSAAAISIFENGKAIPSMNSAYKIARVLDTSIEELFSLDIDSTEKEVKQNA